MSFIFDLSSSTLCTIQHFLMGCTCAKYEANPPSGHGADTRKNSSVRCNIDPWPSNPLTSDKNMVKTSIPYISSALLTMVILCVPRYYARKSSECLGMYQNVVINQPGCLEELSIVSYQDDLHSKQRRPWNRGHRPWPSETCCRLRATWDHRSTPEWDV